MSKHPDHDALIAAADALRDAASGTHVAKIAIRKIAADLERIARTPPTAPPRAEVTEEMVARLRALAASWQEWAAKANGSESRYEYGASKAWAECAKELSAAISSGEGENV